MNFLDDAPIEKSVENIHTLWVEKYRPTILADYIGNEHLKGKVAQYIETQDIPHLLLFGSAGTGKCLDFSEKIKVRMSLTTDEVIKLKQWIL